MMAVWPMYGETKRAESGIDDQRLEISATEYQQEQRGVL